MDSSFWFDTINRDSPFTPLYISRGVRFYLKKNIVFFLSEDLFYPNKQVEPDEMPHYAAFHLGLHCLQKYSFTSFPNT